MSKYATIDPTTGRTERQFDTLDDGGVRDAIARSAAAYSRWRATDVADRARAIAATADLYDARQDELAASITKEMGKPRKEALGEVQLAAAIYRWYAEHGPELLARDELDVPPALESVVTYEPIGPLVGVMPWNYPYYQVARFAAPNLVLGNTVLLKHASICPASALLMEEVLHAAGVPADAYVNLFATSDQVADVIADPAVRGVSLTGSEAAGAAVARTAADNLKKSVLELGGSDALILLDTDDLARSARIAARARLSNCGQACNSPKRMIVPGEYYDEFVAALVREFDAAVVGDPSDDGTQVGPLSSVDARDGVVKQVRRAVEQGATLHTGGEPLAGEGAFMKPAVLTGVTSDMDAYREEIFGPVGVVYRVDSVDEAVALANDTTFGLSASVWGRDLDAARAVADRLDVGMAYVNEHGTTLPGLPFGGVKRSGYGRELGKWGIHEFANAKLRRTSER
ncbi:NAD-dependent succinate-semialdehyde dehydrogenase [Rhodococcus sp. HNM0569]|uniref:NAD-dependent succinate-semialdehyde dehydrogenase n=1 Tax=Rhodococcus sp. HNM0569 TaxID=2716340 RepID=UPI00146D0A14|nr:NAD-dependent succinate-semialdehyde dehydrogenase [Rhodococcus sp. HNM0569]NLU83330.1 NAD-dependent succinate-semialdehyde dehydrogenase [Rhodococcus sp. HNM0569]